MDAVILGRGTYEGFCFLGGIFLAEAVMTSKPFAHCHLLQLILGRAV